MTYLEAVALLHDIEAKYDVMSIKYKGVSVWTHLRIYLLDSISTKSEVKTSGSVVRVVLRSLFSFNPLHLFKKHDCWLITGAERRKQVGEKLIHRISGGFVHCGRNVLMLEKPNSSSGHSQKKLIEEDQIVSMSFPIILEHLISAIFKKRKIIVENENVLKTILTDYGISFNYKRYIINLESQRFAMNTCLLFSRKPSLVFIECPYTMMGFVWSLHNHKIKVIEMQHGVLNANHYGYNAKAYDRRLNPDGICVFGIEEYNYFTKKVPHYAADVQMTGLYMLERADEYFSKDIFEDDRKKFAHIVVVSGQAGFEEQLGEYTNKVACNHPESLFVYIPRHNDVKLNFTCDNIRLVTEVNIYEYLKWADLHITVSSTTCLEAHYFHTPTIFYDYQKMASTYYGTVLAPENAVAYLDDENGFDVAFSHLLKDEFEYREIFAHNHVEKLKKVIEKYIN